MVAIVSALMVSMLLVALAGCSDMAGPDRNGNLLANSRFDVKGEFMAEPGRDSSDAAWVGRSDGVCHYDEEMGDGNIGFLMLKKCDCSKANIPIGYVTQDLRRPITAGRWYDVSFSGTLMVQEGGYRIVSDYARVPVRFVAYNGNPPDHPRDWKEKPGRMAVIGKVDVTAANWHQYRTTVRWRADRNYASFAFFIGDSLVPATSPLPSVDSLITVRELAVFIDNVALWEGEGRMHHNSLFE